MNEQEFNALFGSDAGGQQQQAPMQAAAPQAPAAPAPTGNGGGGGGFEAGLQAAMADFASRGPQNTDSILGAIGSALGAPGVAQTEGRTLTPEEVPQAAAMGGAGFGTGALKSVFETKDFLFGDTPVADQSGFRRDIEKLDADMKQASPIIGGLSSGIGQFAVAMVGLGKVAGVAKMVVPGAKAGVAAVEGIKGGKVALESGKAALAGAIAFDPHEERLSNLVQDTFLANPINEWLAAKPDDSAAWGRVKNAMESIGMDAAIIGTLKLGGTVWKKLKAGDHAGASRTITDFENKHTQNPQAQPAAASPEAQGAVDANAINAASQPPSGSPQANESGQQATGAVLPGENAPQVTGTLGDQSTANPSTTPSGAQVDPTATTSGPSLVDTPTQAMEQAGVAKPQPALKDPVQFTREDMAGSGPVPSAAGAIGPNTRRQTYGLLDEMDLHLENAEKDWDTIEQWGDWDRARDAGHNPSPDMGTFYDRFRTDSDVTSYMQLAVSHKAEQLASKGFRVRLTDEKLKQQVQGFAKLADEDPAQLMGLLEQAGEAARTLTAKMQVAGSLASKAYLDAANMAYRRKLGDYSMFDGDMVRMEEEIAKRFTLATEFLRLTDDIRAQGGRTLRANRGKPFDPALFEGLSRERFMDLLAASRGSPEQLKRLADPSLYRKIMDTVGYLRVASLVSGPKTQLINILSNGYMVGVRPLERILGSTVKAANGDRASMLLLKENLRQYAYMGTALTDGFGQAVKAFTRNDGLLQPHSAEVYAEQGAGWMVPGTQAFGKGYFKPWTSLPNIIHNALSVPLSAAGVPTRTLGVVDELVKQTVYRSKVMARAHMEGVEKALEAGLEGKPAQGFVRSYVAERVEKAFDAEGRGLDAEALREANIATFQQELLPGTFGKGVQSLLSNESSRIPKLILPFIKTPTNVIRYGWKMTPGLNRLQTEYREMLSGKLGHEAQAQAVGQQSMGILFMGSAGLLAAGGMLTGGGPSKPGLKSQMMATGWQPYSIVVTNEQDGTKTYIPYNRYDPIGLPFGIIADISDAYHALGDHEDPDANVAIETAIMALSISLAKQFTSRTYLLSLNQALEALSDPDRNGKAFAGGFAQSLVPFSAVTRQLSGDEYMREARTVADKMLQVIPGMSETLPPRYNWLGEPMLNRQGLWTDDNGSLVDMEVVRMGLAGSSVMGPPDYTIGLKGSKVDLRDITLTTGENAYEAYQRLAGKPTPDAEPLRQVIGSIMATPAYKEALDGSKETPGTRQEMLAKPVQDYRKAAIDQIKADKNVREALMKQLGRVVDHYARPKEQQQQPKGGHSPKDELKSLMDGFGAASGTGN